DAVAGSTITLDGVVWTFVAAITGPNQTVVTGALSSTLNALVAGLSTSGNAGLAVASYGTDGKNLLITYNTAGAGGNSYTLAVAGDPNLTASGATLTGGSGSG